ncbi:MAG: type II toxin-antitoxin system VapC family toxin [Deltaproteobacteria bacterium]|nr:type II toxin-antitoxin system VapC family toxin [Deltaproteobacteria bacterium]
MICYLDSSVVLRKVLLQKNSLNEWNNIRHPFSSRILRLESLRSVDRARLLGKLSDHQTAECRARFGEMITRVGFLPITEAILRRAEEPFATPLGSLDGIHLATAILWREIHGDDLVFATHDKELSLAARAHGFKVIGV